MNTSTDANEEIPMVVDQAIERQSRQHETTTISYISKLLSVKTPDGNRTWMLLTIDRRLWQCDDVGGRQGLSDEIRLELRVLGSLEGGRPRPGESVMDMRGRAESFSSLVGFSDGYIVVENPWRGLRIGTYMMNILVTWATENYPSYSPFDIKLLRTDADEDNKERRNRFYRQFGFRFEWDSTDFSAGTLAEDMKIHELAPVKPEKWEKTILEFDMVRGLEKAFGEVHSVLLGQLSQKHRAQSLEQRCEALERRLNERRQYRMRSGCFRFALAFAAGATACWLALSAL